MAKYDFRNISSGIESETNNKFKRRLAGLPANHYIIARILWKGGIIFGLEHLCSAESIGSLDKATGTTTWYNGSTFTAFPSRTKASALSLVATNNFEKLDYWSSKIENKEPNYRADILVFLLDSSDKKFHRVAAYKDAFIITNKYNLKTTTDSGDSTLKKEIKFEHSGMRWVDPGDEVQVGDYSLTKMEKHFYCDKNIYGENIEVFGTSYFIF